MRVPFSSFLTLDFKFILKKKKGRLGIFSRNWEGNTGNRHTFVFVLFHSCAVFCLVAQSCPTLCNLMDCSPSGSSVHGHSTGKNTGVGCHSLLQIFPTQWSNPGLPWLLHCRRILYHLSHQGRLVLLYLLESVSRWENRNWSTEMSITALKLKKIHEPTVLLLVHILF